MHTNYFNFGRLDRVRVTTTPGTSTTVVVAIVTGVAICTVSASTSVEG